MSETGYEGLGYFISFCVTTCALSWPLAWLAAQIDNAQWWAWAAWPSLVFGGLLSAFFVWAIIGGLINAGLK